jgi:hypothetical protein
MSSDMSLCITQPGFSLLMSNRSDVDDVRGKLTVLQPMKGHITNVLVMGGFKWQDI